ncbi:MAG TPA: hypothetical protein VFJ85_17280 [Acidimicrobiales bacterium]|nr:hypothetical protein [Acidimicrobiales bacterium]
MTRAATRRTEGNGRRARRLRWQLAVATAAAALVFTALPGASAGVLSDSLPGLPADVAAALAPADALLEPPVGAPTLPANPTSALVDALKGLASDMGTPRDPAGAVLKAALSPETAGYLALVATDVLACERITKAHYAAIPPSVLANAAREYGKGLNPSDFNDIRSCALKLRKSVYDLESVLARTVLPLTADIDLWPVLRLSRGTVNNVYLNDYAITIDTGGDDTYVNNAGGNMIDLNFGPAGQPGLKGEGPAKGCQGAIPALLAADCTPVAGVLLDMGGNDRYGVKQTPDVDKVCTADPVIRRMVTNGAGFLGASILVDRGGNDVYSGKTGANGAGHVFGVGMLFDEGGNDTYLAVRNSTGFALVGGIGVFRDFGGDDVYDYYMPAPLDPNAPNQTNGAGGVIDDEGVCDNLPRYDVGGANVAGVGVAVDDAGNDRYRGGFTPDFLAPAPAPGRGGSLGFGNNQGTGVLLDRAGADSYTIVGDQGSPTRGNGVTIPPNSESTGTGAFRYA